MKFLNSKQRIFLLNWVLAAIIGTMASLQVFNSGIVQMKWDYFSVTLDWFVAVGFFISLTQWLVIQQILKVKWWLLTSFVGYILSGVIAGIIDELLHHANIPTYNYHDIFAFVTGAYVGFITGSIQWLSLRQLFSKASSWVIATTLGWALGLMIFRIDFPRFIFTTPSLEPIARFAWLIRIMIFCIPTAGITGLAILKSSSLAKE
jgi:hypothetical protein